MKNTFSLLITIVFCCQTRPSNKEPRSINSQFFFLVGTKVLQFELGSNLVKEKRNVYPNYEVSGYGLDFAVHYGIWKEALELNIQGTYQNDTKSYSSGVIKDETRANFKNFNIGAKYLVYDPNKNKEDKPNLYSYHANRGFKWSSLIPAVSVAGGLNFDSEDNPYTATTVDGVSYRGVLITQNNFAGGWVVVTNFMLDRIGSDQTDLNYTLTLTHSFNPKWVMFAETQGIKSDFYADNLFRIGAGYLLGKNLQLDTALTFNTKDTPSVLNISFGVSYRIDRHDTSN